MAPNSSTVARFTTASTAGGAGGGGGGGGGRLVAGCRSFAAYPAGERTCTRGKSGAVVLTCSQPSATPLTEIVALRVARSRAMAMVSPALQEEICGGRPPPLVLTYSPPLSQLAITSHSSRLRPLALRPSPSELCASPPLPRGPSVIPVESEGAV